MYQDRHPFFFFFLCLFFLFPALFLLSFLFSLCGIVRCVEEITEMTVPNISLSFLPGTLSSPPPYSFFVSTLDPSGPAIEELLREELFF